LCCYSRQKQAKQEHAKDDRIWRKAVSLAGAKSKIERERSDRRPLSEEFEEKERTTNRRRISRTATEKDR
jgi:hypothetical protein